uniref:Uncharacterized protein n=1 Tax=Lepeophtheirus salmonis TaxID=72036 RepID=A0A0K2USE2_LEPSM
MVAVVNMNTSSHPMSSDAHQIPKKQYSAFIRLQNELDNLRFG